MSRVLAVTRLSYTQTGDFYKNKTVNNQVPALPKEPRWRQTHTHTLTERPGAGCTAGCGEIKHGRHHHTKMSLPRAIKANIYIAQLDLLFNV